MKKLIFSNWKNNIQSSAQAREILDAADEYLDSVGENISFTLAFFPAPELTAEISELLKESHLSEIASLGLQDISDQTSDARYALIGHSDRRWGMGDDDATTNAKLKKALAMNICPVVCLGEKSRDDSYIKFLEDQTKNTFAGVRGEDISKCIIAYEPVWAISSTPGASADSPDSASESVRLISGILFNSYNIAPSAYLYGGSISADNIRNFMSNSVFSGVLIGKASTQKEEFIKILQTL